MADIFISYSQRAPESTVALAGDLARQGFAFWYDTSLVPSDVFWKVIMRRITDAKAVIVVWTPASVESEWVYGEAKLAHEQGKKDGRKKLICVRSGDCPIETVPLPFNSYNVSVIDDRAKIYAALAELGLGPAAPAPSPASDPVVGALKEVSLAWELIENKTDPKFFEAFIRQYGGENEVFRLLAEERLGMLQPRAASSFAPAVTPAPPTLSAKEEIAAAASDVILRIDAGMHTSAINRLSIDPTGRLMVSASDDKTVRLWSLPEGRLLRTLRPSIGLGNEGKVYAVALDPGGRWAAAGFWFADGGDNRINIFDCQTGAVLAQFGPLPASVMDLQVSPDGLHLAAGLGGGTGVRAWTLDNEGWTLTLADDDYGGDVYGLAYAHDGRLAATSYDCHVRIYSPDGALQAKQLSTSPGRPYGIAFSPDDSFVAVGSDGAPHVSILDAGTLELAFTPDTRELTNGALTLVGFLADGRLVAGGQYIGPQGDRSIVVWEDDALRSLSLWAGPNSSIMDIAPLPDGGLAYAGGEPSFGYFGADGTRTILHGPPMADLRNKTGQHFLVSSDGLRVRFGLRPFSGDPVLFDLARRTLTSSDEAPADLSPPNISGLTVEGWENGLEPVVKVKTGLFGGAKPAHLALETYEMARCLAIPPGAKSFILGSEWGLRAFDPQGEKIWEKAVPGVTWGVTLARQGRLIIAAYGDGTIRWHRAADGEELLALFVHLPQGPTGPRDWILWTPKGYYEASSDSAEKLIGWHVNRSADDAADFYPVETFSSAFKRPDKIKEALDGV